MSIRNIIPYLYWRMTSSLKSRIATVIGNVMLFWWNVKLHGIVTFHGVPIIVKHYTGKIEIGKDCTFRNSQRSNTAGVNRKCSLNVSAGAEIIIGDNCGLSGAVISADKKIIVGNRVMMGVNCTVLDSDRHCPDPEKRFSGDCGVKADVVIGDDVWLCMNVAVLKGVTIGNGTVVCANSTVTRSLPPGVLAGGAPAKVIREL